MQPNINSSYLPNQNFNYQSQPQMKEYYMSVSDETTPQSYPIGPGNIIWFIDTTHNVIHRKECNNFGALSLRVFDMTERVAPEPVKNESTLEQEIKAIKDQLASILPIIEELKE